MLELRQYQKDAIQFCIENKKAYLAIDMGLGKTAIALKVIEHTGNKALIFAPLSGLDNTWPDEILKWCPNKTYRILHGKNKNEDFEDDADIYLINPHGIKWLYTKCMQYFGKHGKLPFSELIIDEGSMWKGSNTMRFRALLPFLRVMTNHRIILSGTPATNSYLDLWAQYFILDEGFRLFSSYDRYKKEYFIQADREGRVFDFKNSSVKQTILDKIKDITFRVDSKDHLQLPERLDNIISTRFNAKELEQYNKLEANLFLEIDNNTVTAFNAQTLSSKLRQFIQGGMYLEEGGYVETHNRKIQVIKDLTDCGNGSILCAIQFRFELELIRKELKYEVPIIYGKTSPDERNSLMRQWNKGDIPLLLCHPQSLSHSVNIQYGGNIVLWYGLPWSLEHYLQLNKRLHRHGQKHDTVIIHHIVMKDTIDEVIMSALKRKNNNQNWLLNALRDYREEHYID